MIQRSITRRYKFCAAHFLPLVPDGHKCKNLHGHNYRVNITVEAGGLDRAGFVIDFWDLDKIVDPVIKLVDHAGKLNDISGLENPTAEIIAGWFFHKVDLALVAFTLGPKLKKVTVFEEDDCWASQEDLD